MRETESHIFFEYLAATSDASRRTRVMTIILVVASLLTLAGFLNSLHHTWMLERLQALREPASAYARMKLVGAEGSVSPEIYTDHYKAFYQAMVNAYVDNTFSIRVPLLGIVFDPNDLGIVGGLAFITVLFLLRYSLVREFQNLSLSFARANQLESFRDFYSLLAMRQVLTVPPMPGQQEVRFLRHAPKLLVGLPLVVYSAIVIHDVFTFDIGSRISVGHTILVYVIDGVSWAAIVVMTIWCLGTWKRMDDLWRSNSCEKGQR